MQGINHDPMQKPSVIKKYSALELLELGKTFKQVTEDPFSGWLVRLWDVGVDGISVTVAAGKLSDVTSQPPLKPKLHDLPPVREISP